MTGMKFDDEQRELTHIAGEPIDHDKIYLTGILFMAFTGVDSIEPLLAWAKENAHLFPMDSAPEMGKPAKLALVDYYSKAIWYQMGKFDEIDVDQKGFISREDVVRGASKHFQTEISSLCIENIMRAADRDNDGKVSREEFLRVHMSNAWARRDMDVNKDGLLQKEEVSQFAETMIGADEGHKIVEKLFEEVDIEKKEAISQSNIQMWLASNFKLNVVSVPGQSLERNEIKAVQSKLHLL
mmetsp:Transcript_43478/g.137508  ORF Transcript_43478/g.137508 Transcript_43478/m.137508 type:complete len:240 (-) Transcript_43478:132-851(-)